MPFLLTDMPASRDAPNEAAIRNAIQHATNALRAVSPRERSCVVQEDDTAVLSLGPSCLALRASPAAIIVQTAPRAGRNGVRKRLSRRVDVTVRSERAAASAGCADQPARGADGGAILRQRRGEAWRIGKPDDPQPTGAQAR
ncbi:hypothetical protein [Rhizosaccharibacter radicis]|uniref:Uncharacterized protein n=1 Tax=Rhizosaccharibacter radicis TaxID=2782605 RepID=A0ABT1VV02_9PROT|nr:hypothetical protein [Acetobacteraceae bacterium KSS12]